MVARGIRNDNPCNIRRTKDKWQGMRETQTDKAFVQFKSRLWGYRAVFIILRNYITKGKDTIGKIIAKWAPSSDGNNTQSYINYVSKSTGINASHALKFEDKDDLVEIVRSMAHITWRVASLRTRRSSSKPTKWQTNKDPLPSPLPLKGEGVNTKEH